MNRRFFGISTLGLLFAGLFSNKADAKNQNRKTSSTFLPDDADEEIKVIQSKRPYRHQKKKIDGVCTSLLFFADVHLAEANIKKIAAFYSKHKKYIDDAVHLGDSVGNINKGDFRLWENFPEALNIIGNHDTYASLKPRKILSDKEKYSLFFERYVGEWKVGQPNNAKSDGKCYWHKDYQNHLRVVGLDCMRPNEAQLDWFEKLLEDARKKNLKILVATHIPPECGSVLECNFSSLDYVFKNDSKNRDDFFKNSTEGKDKNYRKFVSAVDGFVSAGGTFVCWICGHLHHDQIMFVKDTKHKQLLIALECATNYNLWTDANHADGTNTETCWEIVSIESVSNVVKIARFGNNYDHYLRHKGTFCYDFKNHKLISQS